MMGPLHANDDALAAVNLAAARAEQFGRAFGVIAVGRELVVKQVTAARSEVAFLETVNPLHKKKARR